MEILIAILKAIAFVVASLGASALIIFGMEKKPILTASILLLALISFSAVMFYIKN